MFRETATAVNNGKERFAVKTAHLKDDLVAVVQQVIASNLEADAIHELFNSAGVPVSREVVSSFIRQRCERQHATA
jgi:hypothetical protein